MAPELLERQDLESLDFASLRKADMYSFSLVLWEIARKCWIQGSCTLCNRIMWIAGTRGKSLRPIALSSGASSYNSPHDYVMLNSMIQ